MSEDKEHIDHKDNEIATSCQLSTSTEGADLGDKLGDAHLNILPTKKLMVCLAALSLGLFASFVDQTSITVALPSIGKDLNSETTINWASAASLLANCACQVLFGRLADIFGRKTMLLSSLAVLGIADLACGFAQTGVQFFIFRAFTGIGGGGIQSLTMVMVSDICTLKQRGKYQGILGSQVGLGNAVGPFIMAAFIEKNSWRNFYHMMTPLIAAIMCVIWYFIDTKESSKNLDSVLSRKEKFKKLDYLGMFFSTASLTLLLIPLSGGGSTYAWNSSLVIGMFVVGGLCLIIFVLVEWKIPTLPMIPLSLFTRPSLAMILGSNFFYGMAYYGFTYYISYYYQIVSEKDPIHAAILMLPLVLSLAISSTLAGQLVSLTGHYKWIILVGYGVWTVACGLTLLFNINTNYGVIVVILLVMGSGVGWTFQPTLVAAQSQSKKSERAVVISARNVLRSFGGAIGIAIASLIVSNTLLKQVNQQLQGDSILPKEYLINLKTHIYSQIDTTGLSAEQIVLVKTMYMKSLHNFFYLTIPLIGLCFVSTIFITDHGLHCIDEEPEKLNHQDKEESSVNSNV